jgi:hypothetical protein
LNKFYSNRKGNNIINFKKKIYIAGLLCSSLILGGCAAGSKTTIKAKKGDMEVIIKHEHGGSLINNLLKPVASLVANSGVISTDDWIDFNPSNFYIQLQNSNSQSTAGDVTFKLYSYRNVIGSKTFSTNTMGNNVYFSSPSSFKAWADNYVVDTDEVRFTLDLSTTYFGSGTLTTKYYQDGNMVAAVTNAHTCSNGEMEYFCTVD